MAHRSAPRPYVLAETTWKAVSSTRFDVAVLPWGATEAHNYHLPYATDVIQCDHIAAESARLAWERGARVAVLPTVPFGVQTGQLDIPLCINVNPSTQLAMLEDIASALGGQGIRKLVVLNGHGGNDFRAMIRDLQPRVPDVFLCVINWWNCVDAKPHFTHRGITGGARDECDDARRAGARAPARGGRTRARAKGARRGAARGVGVGPAPVDGDHGRHRRRRSVGGDGGEGGEVLRARDGADRRFPHGARGADVGALYAEPG